MSFFQAAIFGIVEGLTEFLPISSTAHLEITAKLLGITQTDFIKTFEIVIQGGAILAVVFLYFGTLVRNRQIWLRIITAFIPTAIVGFVLYKIIKQFLLGGNLTLLVWTIGLGGVVLIICDFYFKNKNKSIEQSETTLELSSMPLSKAFWIGLAQALAIVPGVSRSAATIIAGRFLGLSRAAVVEFSFLLAIPTIAAAAVYDLYKSATVIPAGGWSVLATGFIVSFISALIAVKFFIAFVRSRTLTAFGVYRIILALFIAFFLLP